jgi:hypothetical protein
VILLAIYMLTLVQRVFWNPLVHEENKRLTEIRPSELVAAVVLVLAMVWIGVRPERRALAPRPHGRGDPRERAREDRDPGTGTCLAFGPGRHGGRRRALIPFGPRELATILPEICLAAAGCLIVLLEAFAPRTRRAFATITLAAIAASLYFLARAPIGTTFGGRLETSALTNVVSLFLAATAAIATLVAKPYLERTGAREGGVLRSPPLGTPRRVAHGSRARSHRRVHRTRDALACLLRSRGDLPQHPVLLGRPA